ncbi:MAG: efflux RND transporter permease subunit [Bradymonadaceae bacterium]|nr:efflux RND transporter permease subunit [Lujinxingiaceae bacterium]
MSTTAYIVKNRHTVWAILIATIFFGTVSYLTLPMQLFPDTSPPLVNVITGYPGASAEDVARDLTQVLEEEFAALEGIVKVKSSSEDNLSIISLEFDFSRPADQAAIDVQNALARQGGRLPSGIEDPRVLKFDTSDRPVITLGAITDDLLDARRVSEDVIGPRLQRLDGVAAVDVFGGFEEAILVEVDMAKLTAYGVPIFRIVDAITRQYTALPAGRIRTEREETMFRIETRGHRLESLEGLTISTPDGTQHRLSDLATIRSGHLDDDAEFAINGRRAIGMQVFKTTEANTVEVVRAVEAAATGLGAELDGVEIVIGEESASFTETSISNLLSNVWQAILLAAIIIFLFLGRLRASLVAGVSMPLSYGLTFIGMTLFGVEFNMVTLTAVILAVGMVVDASVVVLENIVRMRDLGRGAEDAAIEGTDGVIVAVVAGAATTVAVLVPLLLVPGFVGKTFGPLALTLLLAFLSSVVVALFIVPVLSLFIGDGKGRLDRLGERLTLPFRALMDGLRAVYVKVLSLALNQRTLTVVLAVASLVAGMAGIKARGMEVLPKMDTGSFYVSFETPSGSSLEETSRAARAIEAILRAEPEVLLAQRQTGFERGMRSFSATGAQGATQGFITVTLTPRTERTESLWEIQDRVSDAVRRVPNLEAFVVRELGNTAKSTTSAPVAVVVSGEDRHVLDKLAEEVLVRLEGVEGVVNPVRTWRLDRRRTRVEIDPLRTGPLGLSPADVAMQMQGGSQGMYAGDFYGPRDTAVPIRVRYEARQRPSDLLAYPVIVPATGESVPLRAIANHVPEVGTALVTRENLIETLEVTAYNRGRALSFVTADVGAALEGMVVPRGYEVKVGGESGDLDEAKGGLGKAMAMAIIAVYLLLLVQLRSFARPLVIMVSVPLSLVGVSTALGIVGSPVSMPVMVGLILLVGIVVNNAIILIDFVAQARDAGMKRREALVSAVQVRFRPIMMTSISTIVGMIPLAAAWALGAERFAPLAVAVIGGMIASTILTLIVIPVFYDIVESTGERLGRLLKPRPAAQTTVALLGLVAALGVVMVPASATAQDGRPITLEESIELALDHSPNLRERAHGTQKARQQREEAGARRLPRVEVLGRYSRLSYVEPGTITLELPGAPEPRETQLSESIENVYSLRVQVDQPLFAGGALRYGVEAADLGIEVSNAVQRLHGDDVILAVEESYFTLMQVQKSVATVEQSARALEAHRARLVVLVDAGRATALELQVLDVRQAEADVRLSRARAGVEHARRRLNHLMGLDLETALVLIDADAKLGRVDAPHEAAMRQRPELEVARLQTTLEETKARIADGAKLPQLYLSAGYTLANPHERYFPARDEFNHSWDVSLLVRWTAWDWGVTRARRAQAEYDVLIARERTRALEEATRFEVIGRARDVELAAEEVHVTDRAVAAAATALATAERLFAAGKVLSTEVLDREGDLFRARQAHVEAVTAHRLANARLARVTGSRSLR